VRHRAAAVLADAAGEGRLLIGGGGVLVHQALLPDAGAGRRDRPARGGGAGGRRVAVLAVDHRDRPLAGERARAHVRAGDRGLAEERHWVALDEPACRAGTAAGLLRVEGEGLAAAGGVELLARGDDGRGGVLLEDADSLCVGPGLGLGG